MANFIILKGRLTKDIELKQSQSNIAIANSCIAVDRKTKKEGEQTADFFYITAFGKQAETMANYLKKGSEVLIQGHLQNRSWETPDGIKRYATDVIVDNCEFCGKKPESTLLPKNVNVVEDDLQDSLPF